MILNKKCFDELERALLCIAIINILKREGLSVSIDNLNQHTFFDNLLYHCYWGKIPFNEEKLIDMFKRYNIDYSEILNNPDLNDDDIKTIKFIINNCSFNEMFIKENNNTYKNFTFNKETKNITLNSKIFGDKTVYLVRDILKCLIK